MRAALWVLRIKTHVCQDSNYDLSQLLLITEANVSLSLSYNSGVGIRRALDDSDCIVSDSHALFKHSAEKIIYEN